jgi:hypothetical protein
MSGNEERRVKARQEITQFYKGRRLPRGDMMISGDPNPNANSRMMMLKMRHVCHLPRLVLMEKGWQVLVAAGWLGMRRLRRK